MSEKTSLWQKIQRCYEHVLLDRDDVFRLLGEEFLAAMSSRVTASEMHHSGEICICIESSLPVRSVWAGMSSRERAQEVFAQRRVWDTEQNNGVLIYFLLADHAIEVVSDRGVMSRVSITAWQHIVHSLQQAFRLGAYEAGLIRALEEVTAILVEHYPLEADAISTNELDDCVMVM